MQRYFIDKDLFKDEELILTDSNAHHIKDVMRYKKSDKLIINTFKGKVFLAEITDFMKKEVVVKIIEEIKSDYKPLNLDLGISLIKKDNFELILQKTTEIGIKKIIPLKTERSIIKIDDFSKKKQRYETIIKEASEQSERSILPIIDDYSDISLLDLIDYDHKFVCYAREDSLTINEALKLVKPSENVLVLIGPEGGFSLAELTELTKKGFVSVSLGKTILRAETAAIYVASIFRFLWENKE
jgi:16S rRNA (uracil1498-N3)-methyltransferase